MEELRDNETVAVRQGPVATLEVLCRAEYFGMVRLAFTLTYTGTYTGERTATGPAVSTIAVMVSGGTGAFAGITGTGTTTAATGTNTFDLVIPHSG